MPPTWTDVSVTLRYRQNGTWHSTDFYGCRPADFMYDLPSHALQFHQCVEDICKPHIEKVVSCITGSLPILGFIDDEGDWILLVNVDSYIEAMKVAKKTGRLVIVTSEPASTSVTVEMLPAWFAIERQKIKDELKREILSEIGKASDVATDNRKCQRPSVLAQSSRPTPLNETADAKSTKGGDYISRAIQDHVELVKIARTSLENGNANVAAAATGGAKPKIRKGDYISRAVGGSGGLSAGDTVPKMKHSNEMPTKCGICACVIGEPYFMCLDSGCMLTLCRNCELQHPPAHAMLRLPMQLAGGRREAAYVAKKILLSMNKSKHQRKRRDKKHGDNCKDGRWAADCVTMDVVSDGAGVAVVKWTIVNTGKKTWDDRVKLGCLACSDIELKPVDWQVPVPRLKCGQSAFVEVKLITPQQPGEYKTFWILSRDGKRFANLTATIPVLPTSSEMQESGHQTTTVAVEHSYAVAATERKDSPTSEPFEVVDRQQSGEAIDERSSQISGITECKSTVVEQEYDIIPGLNGDCTGNESMEEEEEKDSSYVSIASPILFDESSDNTNDLTEMWQRLSISLSSLTIPNGAGGSDTEIIFAEDVVVAQMEATEKDDDGDVELVDEERTVADDVVTTVEKVEEQKPMAAPITENEQEIDEHGDNAQVVEREEAEAREAAVGEDNPDGGSVTYSSCETKSVSSSRSASFDSTRHQIKETVTSAISNALLTTTQTLATVGATAKEIQTAAAAIVRSNFHGNAVPKQTYHTRAWVPKATQTSSEDEDMTDASGDAAPICREEQLQRLVEMGFLDVEKNERLLQQFEGNIDRVILALVSE